MVMLFLEAEIRKRKRKIGYFRFLLRHQFTMKAAGVGFGLRIQFGLYSHQNQDVGGDW